MRAKEKAKELVLKMYDNVQDATAGMFEKDVPYVDARFKAAKGAALIAVDAILYALNDDDLYIQGETNIEDSIDYYKQVKTEIEKGCSSC